MTQLLCILIETHELNAHPISHIDCGDEIEVEGALRGINHGTRYVDQLPFLSPQGDPKK